MRVKRVLIEGNKWEVRMENGTVWHLYKKDVLEFSNEQYGDLLDFLGRMTHIREIDVKDLELHGFYQK